MLVGVDGSREASAALRTVAGLLGERLGRFTIAAVLDFDTAESDMQWDERDRALAELARDADEVEPPASSWPPAWPPSSAASPSLCSPLCA